MGREYKMRFAGSGGQGVITASIIFADAAVASGLNVVQTQRYGPEARGGASRAEIMISREKIWFSQIEEADLLLCMNQISFDKYSGLVKSSGLILVDSTVKDTAGVKNIVSFPMIKTARELAGGEMSANIVALGVVNRLTGLLRIELLHEALRRHLPEYAWESSERALSLGFKLKKVPVLPAELPPARRGFTAGPEFADGGELFLMEGWRRICKKA